MQHSKLIDILHNLSKAQQNRFVKWVQSAYHNQHEDVKKLLMYILDNQRYTWELAFDFLFPNQPYKVQKLRNVMSYLQKLLDEFLGYEQWTEKPIQPSLELLQAYRQHKLDKAFAGALEYAQHLQEKSPQQNANFYYWDYRLQLEQYEFANQQERSQSKNLQELLDSFEIYYLANKLKYSVIALSHQAVYKTQYDLGILTQFIDNLQNSRWLDIPAISVYYYSYRALTQWENSEHFYKLKPILLENAQLFPNSELKDLYILAINCGVKYLNQGKDEFVKEVFELYQQGLEKQFFIEKNELSRFTYKNVVSLGLKLGKLDWTKDFIEQYAPFLKKEYRQTEHQYNLAKWYYMNKDYKIAMQMLLTLNNIDLSTNLGSKTTLLKIYYEINEWDALDSLLASFRIFIKRNQDLSDFHKTSYLNLIRFTQKLVKHNHFDPKEHEKIRLLIESEPHLPERSWLLEQLL